MLLVVAVGRLAPAHFIEEDGRLAARDGKAEPIARERERGDIGHGEGHIGDVAAEEAAHSLAQEREAAQDADDAGDVGRDVGIDERLTHAGELLKGEEAEPKHGAGDARATLDERRWVARIARMVFLGDVGQLDIGHLGDELFEVHLVAAELDEHPAGQGIGVGAHAGEVLQALDDVPREPRFAVEPAHGDASADGVAFPLGVGRGLGLRPAVRRGLDVREIGAERANRLEHAHFVDLCWVVVDEHVAGERIGLGRAHAGQGAQARLDALLSLAGPGRQMHADPSAQRVHDLERSRLVAGGTGDSCAHKSILLVIVWPHT